MPSSSVTITSKQELLCIQDFSIYSLFVCAKEPGHKAYLVSEGRTLHLTSLAKEETTTWYRDKTNLEACNQSFTIPFKNGYDGKQQHNAFMNSLLKYNISLVLHWCEETNRKYSDRRPILELLQRSGSFFQAAMASHTDYNCVVESTTYSFFKSCMEKTFIGCKGVLLFLEDLVPGLYHAGRSLLQYSFLNILPDCNSISCWLTVINAFIFLTWTTFLQCNQTSF